MSKLNDEHPTKAGNRLVQGGRARIADIPAAGEELSEEHLRFVSGGEAMCGCPANAQTCRVTTTPSGNGCFAAWD